MDTTDILFPPVFVLFFGFLMVLQKTTSGPVVSFCPSRKSATPGRKIRDRASVPKYFNKVFGKKQELYSAIFIQSLFNHSDFDVCIW